jgi:UDP-3-O-[3-hydroxymyristoyl] glucosamine N-acyltransferase
MIELTLSELAEQLGAELIGDADLVINGVDGLESAGPGDLSFLASSHYLPAMRRSKAGAVLISPETQPISRRNYLVCSEPAKAFETVVSLFYPESEESSGFEGVHETALIHESAQLGLGVVVGPYAVIDRNVTIGDGSHIGAHSYVGPGVTVGEECVIHPRVTIHASCRLGNRVGIYSGAVLGSSGFGYTTNRLGHHSRLRHVAQLVIEDDVEIGANSVVDRGLFKETRIKRGSKIDGLVQIAHGVSIGEDNLIVGQTGIAGSSKTGRHVILAGQVGIKDHVELADGVICGARTGVMKSLLEPGKYAGEPAAPIRELGPQMLALRKLTSWVERIHKLEQRLAELEPSKSE